MDMDEILTTLKEHRYVIQRNREDVEAIKSMLEKHIKEEDGSIERLHNMIEPVVGLLHDVAAVGRFGSWLKNAVIWIAVVGGALAAAYEYFRHIGQK
mgnify:CR=1 FL=1